jgi:hypothetical protein
MFVVRVCALTNKISGAFHCKSGQIFINTRVLKHLYDRKPAEEFDFIITHLAKLLADPDLIFCNKSSKRGDYVFVKQIDLDRYFCSLEVASSCKKTCSNVDLHVVTVFRLRKKNYLHNYKLVWSRRGDIPSS